MSVVLEAKPERICQAGCVVQVYHVMLQGQ